MSESEDSSTQDSKRNVVVIGAGIIGVTTAYQLAKYGYNVTVLEKCPTAAQFCSYSPAGVAKEYKKDSQANAYRHSLEPLLMRQENSFFRQMTKSLIDHINPFYRLSSLSSSLSSCSQKNYHFSLRDNAFCDPQFLLSKEGLWFSFYLIKRKVDNSMKNITYSLWTTFASKKEKDDDQSDKFNRKYYVSNMSFHNWSSYCWDKFLYTLFQEGKYLDDQGYKIFDGYAHVYPQSGEGAIWRHLKNTHLPNEYSPYSTSETTNLNVRSVEDHGKALAGSCHDLTQLLVDKTKKMGVNYKFNTEVKKILTQNGKIYGIHTKENEFINVSRVVICGGALSSYIFNRLIYECNDNFNNDQQISLKRLPFLPIVPLQGYTIQTNCEKYPYPYGTHILLPGRFHVTHVKDDKIHITNYGYFRPIRTVLQRWKERTPATMYYPDNPFEKALWKDFERIADTEIRPAMEVQDGEWKNHFKWTGFRPYTPDGLPIVSKVNEVQGLYLNCGHGFYGFMASFGSAHLLRKIMLWDDETRADRRIRCKMNIEEKQLSEMLSYRRFTPLPYLS